MLVVEDDRDAREILFRGDFGTLVTPVGDAQAALGFLRTIAPAGVVAGSSTRSWRASAAVERTIGGGDSPCEHHRPRARQCRLPLSLKRRRDNGEALLVAFSETPPHA